MFNEWLMPDAKNYYLIGCYVLHLNASIYFVSDSSTLPFACRGQKHNWMPSYPICYQTKHVIIKR